MGQTSVIIEKISLKIDVEFGALLLMGRARIVEPEVNPTRDKGIKE